MRGIFQDGDYFRVTKIRLLLIRKLSPFNGITELVFGKSTCDAIGPIHYNWLIRKFMAYHSRLCTITYIEGETGAEGLEPHLTLKVRG